MTSSLLRRGQLSETAAVRDVSVEAWRNQILGIVGESGSGKTTLIRLLLALEAPSAGTVLFKGVDLAGAGADVLREMRRSVQVVFQNPASSLNPRMRVRDIVAEPLQVLRPNDAHERNDRIRGALAKVELPKDAGDRYPHQLSIGQRQRVAIARAIVVEPELVIMDEPVSALDVSVAARVLDLIVRLSREESTGIVMVSHNLAHVATTCHRIAVMYGGRVVEQGPTRDVFKDPQSPHAKELIAAVPRPPYRYPGHGPTSDTRRANGGAESIDTKGEHR